MTFVREITTVIICFLFNLAIVSIMKTRLGPRPFAPRAAAFWVGSFLPPPHPASSFQKGFLGLQCGSLATAPSVFSQPLNVVLTLKACTVQKKTIF